MTDIAQRSLAGYRRGASTFWSHVRDEIPNDVAAGLTAGTAYLFVAPHDPPRVVLYTDEPDVQLPWWVDGLAARFAHLTSLGANWNSHGAEPVRVESAALAVRVLLAVIGYDPLPAPMVMPTVRGGVQLEWHQSDTDLEIDIDPRGEVFVWCHDKRDQKEWEGDLSDRKADVRRTLEMLSSRSADPLTPA